MKEYCLYVLIDEEKTPKVRYVGVTGFPKRRLLEHKRHFVNPYLRNWIRKTASSLKVLRTYTDEAEAYKKEIFLIKTLRKLGFKLTNICDGGIIPPHNRSWLGKKHAPETIVKLKQSWTPERKAKISANLRGRKFSEEHKKNLSLNHADIKGKKHPLFGMGHSEETRKKMRKPKINTKLKYTVNGMTKSITEWSMVTGINARTIRTRLLRGWEPIKAIFEEPKNER